MGWSGGDWDRDRDRDWDRDRDRDREHQVPTRMHGVDVLFVCGCVPVLSLEKASIFHEHASMLLQTALNNFDKADSLFEDCEDDDVLRGCRSWGLRADDVHLARLKRSDLKGVRAAGTTKRSVMLALVLGLSLHEEFHSRELWDVLWSYDLYGPFLELVSVGKGAMSSKRDLGGGGKGGQRAAAARGSSLSPSPARSEPPIEGVDVCFVCGRVPVIMLEKGSCLDESASWLLQTALSSEGKAGGLYEYCNDREILAGCRGMGIPSNEAFVGRIAAAELQGVRAVGTTGKRSVMLALVIALLLQRRVGVSQFRAAVEDYSAELWPPLAAILRRARGGGRGGGGGGDPPKAGGASQAKRPRLQAASPTPEERRARGERARRFDARTGGARAGGAEAAAGMWPPEKGGEAVLKGASPDDKPLEGSCAEVERPYLRSSGVRRASDVRPPHVLKQAFALVRERWGEKRDWVYASEMLWGIRQELTMQMVRDTFAVEVYEFSTRTALEVGDFKHFELCSTQLEELYGTSGGGAGGDDGSPLRPTAEFLAYRLLWLTLRGERLALAAFRRRRARELRVSGADPLLTVAAAFRAALEGGNLLRACRLAADPLPASLALPGGEAAGAAMRRLLAELLEERGARLRVLAAACRATYKDKPQALLALVRRLLAPTGAPRPTTAKALRGLPLALLDCDPPGLDWRATAEDAERLIARVGLGARKQLGEQSADHMRDFVRGGPSV